MWLGCRQHWALDMHTPAVYPVHVPPLRSRSGHRHQCAPLVAASMSISRPQTASTFNVKQTVPYTHAFRQQGVALGCETGTHTATPATPTPRFQPSIPALAALASEVAGVLARHGKGMLASASIARAEQRSPPAQPEQVLLRHLCTHPRYSAAAGAAWNTVHLQMRP